MQTCPKNRRTFKESLRRLFLLYTFMPIVALFILFFIFTLINSKIVLVNKTAEASDLISKSFLEVYNRYYEEINRMAASPLVIDLARTRLNSQNVYEEFYDFNNVQQVKSVFHLVDTRGVVLASTSPSDTYIDDVLIRGIIPRINKKPMATLTEANHIRYSHDRFTVYTFGRAVMDRGDIVGYLIYQLYEDDVQKLISVQNNEIALITDQHNTIIATTSNITKGLMNKFNPSLDSNGYVELNEGKYYMSERVFPFAQLHVYTLNSTNSEKYVYISLSVFILSTSFLLWFLIRFLANKMSTQNTQSIDKLLFAMNQLQQGNLVSYVELKSGDEFETLAEQYNLMLNQLNILLKKNEELSNLRRSIEVKQLQSQFHPHFIFNVLETLRYAILVDSRQAQEIVMTLSRLLRYSINNDEQTVQLKDDLNYVQDYLKLQQIRFGNRLEFEMNVSEAARNALVPKLLIQAIVENCIKYGYKHRESILVLIDGYISEDNLVMEVLDNGYGMNEERLEQIRKILGRPNNPTNHLGLHNTHRRLVLLYGVGYGVQINSTLGEGTSVRIVIPYKVGDDAV